MLTTIIVNQQIMKLFFSIRPLDNMSITAFFVEALKYKLL